MAPRVPVAVREAWGDELVAEVVPWLEQVVQEKAVPRDEYREVLSRLDVLEHDVTDVKTDVRELRREMNERFDRINERSIKMERHFEARFDQMNERFDTRFDQMSERFDRMNERFIGMERHFEGRLDQMSERMLTQTRWLIGSIALFGTVLTILMAIAQFTP